MFGLTEIVELSTLSNNAYDSFYIGIVPTILLPLAFLSTGISIVATFIASLFGVELKAEGPKKLLEILLRPRVLISALFLNTFIYGGFHLYEYAKNGPVPELFVKLKNMNITFEKGASVNPNGWVQNLEEGVFAKGLIYKDELYVGTTDGNLFVLKHNEGDISKKMYFGKFLSPTPVLFKNALYFGEGLHQSHHMHLYKFDPEKKELTGKFKTKGHTEIFPVTATIDQKDYIFQSAGEDGLYAIDPHSMKEIWHYTDGHMDAFALVHNKSVYIASGLPEEDIGKKRPFAYKLDAQTGKLLWKKELPLSSWYGPVLVKENICFIQGEIHVESNVGGILCFEENGNRLHSLFIESPIIGKPLVQGEIIYFNDYYGNLYAWNAISNEIIWQKNFNLTKGSYSSLQFFNQNKLIHVLRNGKILLVNIDDGEIVQEHQFPSQEPVFADPLVHQENIYIFGMKGLILKKKIKI